MNRILYVCLVAVCAAISLPAAPAPQQQSAAQKENINPETYKAKCQKRQPAACYNYGMLFAAGMGVPRDAKMAASVWQRGCDIGEGESCRALADAYHRGAGVDKNLSRARELLLNACGKNVSQACTDLGEASEEGTLGQRRNYTQAAWLYSQACDMQNGEACYRLGQLHQKGLGVERSASNAALSYQKACKLNVEDACEELKDADSNEQQATSYVESLERSCLSDKAVGCAIVGRVFHDGLSRKGVNLERAYKVWDHGCEHGNAESCLMQSRMIYLGEGTEQDSGYALALTEKSCNLGSPEACFIMSQIYSMGIMDAERDHEVSAKFSSKACEMSHPQACFRLGQMYERGLGVRGSLKIAERYFNKACSFDIEQGCEKAAKGAK